MAEQNSTQARRRLIAAGVKRGSGPLVVESMSPADASAHDLASYVRAPSVSTTPATVALCRADYEAGADVRATFTRQQKRGR